MTGNQKLSAALRFSMAAAIAVSMVTLGGCREGQYNRYRHARDTISLSAGDAVAHNKAVQTIDPWPVYARKRRQTTDGKRVLLSMERYQKNESIEPQGMSTSETYEDAGGSPPPAPPAQ
ncbi:MAG: hypothetical protein ACTSP0_10415 [Alphaproteobacteria bacterium]